MSARTCLVRIRGSVMSMSAIVAAIGFVGSILAGHHVGMIVFIVLNLSRYSRWTIIIFEIVGCCVSVWNYAHNACDTYGSILHAAITIGFTFGMLATMLANELYSKSLMNVIRRHLHNNSATAIVVVISGGHAVAVVE